MTDTPPDLQSQQNGKAADYFRELASRKVERPKAPPSYATRAALVLGAILGLAYGVATQLINPAFSPGIPYAHHPFGIVGNCLASMLGLMLVCLVCSLPKDMYRGAVLGSFISVAVLEIRALFLGTPLLTKTISITSMFAVIGLLFEVVLSIPVMLGLRWTIDIQAERFDKPIWSWKRIRFPLGFMIAAAALSILSLYPDDVRAAMANTVTLIAGGRAATTAALLPEPLRSENGVPDFRSHAEFPYTVELGEQSLLANDIAPQFRGFVIVIIARFADGWTLACAYVNNLGEPVCRGYGPANRPPITDYWASLIPGLLQ